MTEEGMSLIAQVYPVFVILIAIESSRLRVVRPIDTARRAVSMAVRQLLVIFAVFGALTSTSFCVLAVASGDPLAEWQVAVVALSGIGLWATALLLIGDLVSANFNRQIDEGEWEGFNSWVRRRRDDRASQTSAKHD